MTDKATQDRFETEKSRNHSLKSTLHSEHALKNPTASGNQIAPRRVESAGAAALANVDSEARIAALREQVGNLENQLAEGLASGSQRLAQEASQTQKVHGELQAVQQALSAARAEAAEASSALRLSESRCAGLDGERRTKALEVARLQSELGAMSLGELELHRNRLSGSLPSELGGRLARSLRRCVLVAAQGPHQPFHSMRTADRHGEPDTNRFDCPLPETLPRPCASHLNCTDEGAAARRSRKARGGRRWTRRKSAGRGGGAVARR